MSTEGVKIDVEKIILYYSVVVNSFDSVKVGFIFRTFCEMVVVLTCNEILN